KAIKRLQGLCDRESGAVTIHLTRTENWSVAILDFVATEPAERRTAWAKLLSQAGDSGSPKPTKKWLKDAKSLVDKIGPDVFRDRFLEWMALVEKGGHCGRAAEELRETREGHLIMDNVNAQVLKGLVWCATLLGDDDELIRTIGRLGASC